MKRLLMLLVWGLLAWCAAAAPAVILTPDAVAADPAKRRTVEAFRTVLQQRGVASRTAVPAELAEAIAPDTVAVIGWALDNYPAAAWRTLGAFRDRGGALVFQAKTVGRLTPDPAFRAALADLFGAEFGGYVADPELGKKRIDRYMFLRPADADTWGAEHPPLFAAYAGEAFALTPVSGGRAVADWVRRDRDTADGAAVVVKAEAGKGWTALIGGYPFDLAAKNDRKELNLFHASLLVNRLLVRAGLKLREEAAAAGAKQRYTEPLNLHPIEPAFAAPRAMWLWNVDYALNPAERKVLLDFTAGRRISTLYLCVGERGFSAKNRPALRAFLREARARGISVEALDGWKEAMLPDRQAEFLASLQRVLDYNAAVPAAERFSGFQSDVEPVTLKEYHASPENRRRIDRLYVQLHARCRDLIRQSGQRDFVLGMATSEYLANDLDKPERYVEWDGRTAAVLTHLAEIADYFAVMSYHDKAARVEHAAAGQVEIMGRLGKKTFPGVETLDVVALFGGSRSITFYEEGLTAMERELAGIHAAFAGKPGYGGLAIHHYESYRRMTDGRRPLNLPPAPELIARPAGTAAEPCVADRAEQVVYGVKNWRGPRDFSAVWSFHWNERELTVTCDVTDDRYEVGDFTGEELWKGDHLELWLGAPDGDAVFQLGVSPEPGRAVWLWHPVDRSAEERAGLAALVRVESRRREGGYTVECVIPAAFLGLQKIKSGDILAILAEVGDTDQATDPAQSMLSLAPHRDREDSATYNRLKLLGPQP